jgi:hypothetical protein
MKKDNWFNDKFAEDITLDSSGGEEPWSDLSEHSGDLGWIGEEGYDANSCTVIYDCCLIDDDEDELLHEIMTITNLSEQKFNTD